MLGALIGAGFSKWAADLPVASGLFDFSIRPRGIKEERRLKTLMSDKAEWDSKFPGHPSEQFIAWMLEKKPRHQKRITWYVTRRLSDPFLAKIWGGIQTFIIDEKRAREHPSVVRAQHILGKFLGSGVSGIITCNYDLLIEYALTTRHFNYGIKGALLKGRNKNPLFFTQGGPVYLRGDTKISKVHGSVSWDTKFRYTDGRSGLKGNALIVPPAPEKTPPLELLDQWNLAATILKESTHLLVFGFAFNQYDQALLKLLSDNGKNLKEVLLVDIFPKLDLSQATWPNACITTVKPPSAPAFAWEKWFRKSNVHGDES